MRGLNNGEIGQVHGGIGPEPSPPPPGVSQWEWDQLRRMLEEQNKRNGQQQN